MPLQGNYYLSSRPPFDTQPIHRLDLGQKTIAAINLLTLSAPDTMGMEPEDCIDLQRAVAAAFDTDVKSVELVDRRTLIMLAATIMINLSDDLDWETEF